MLERDSNERFRDDALQKFSTLVESVGVKRFSTTLALSTRQVNRILSGVQPNPVERIIRSLQAADADTGDRVLDFICQEMGGYFVREEAITEASTNAVKECAEAIAAISDGEITSVDVNEVREAISALVALLHALPSTTETTTIPRLNHHANPSN